MIEDAIRRFIDEELASNGRIASVTDDYPLLEREVLDSLSLFQLVDFVEREYSIEVADEELVPENFGTVRQIARMVATKQA